MPEMAKPFPWDDLTSHQSYNVTYKGKKKRSEMIERRIRRRMRVKGKVSKQPFVGNKKKYGCH